MDTVRATSLVPAATAAYLASRRVGRLATVDSAGRPHVIPVCYAFDGVAIDIALDAKPKRVAVTALKRVRNLLANPAVTLVVDDYDDDWSRLAYVLVEGTATLVYPDAPDHALAIARLRAVYPQYHAMAIDRNPLIRIAIQRTTAWGNLEPAPAKAQIDRLSVTGVIRGRRSVRAYTDRPVPRPLVDACLAAAGWAPSPHGRQPWRFARITQTGVKQRLSAAMAGEWQRNLALDGQDPAVVATRLARSHARLMEAPVLVLACLYLADLDAYPDAHRQGAEATMAVQSLGAALQNLLLTAYHLGLDTGWMCAPLFCPETVVAALGLDPALTPQALITLGYAAGDPVRRPRRPLGDLLVLDS